MSDFCCFTEFEKRVVRYSRDDGPLDHSAVRGVFSNMSERERQMAFDELESMVNDASGSKYRKLVEDERSERIGDEGLIGATAGTGAGLALALRNIVKDGGSWEDIHPTAALAAVPLMSGLGYLIGRGAGYLFNRSTDDIRDEYYRRAWDKAGYPRPYSSRPSGLTAKEEEKLEKLFLSDPRVGLRVTPKPWLELKSDIEDRGRRQWLSDALASGLSFGSLGAALGGIGTHAVLRASGVESESIPWVGAGLGALLAGSTAAKIASDSAQRRHLERKKVLDELAEIDRLQEELDDEYRREALKEKFKGKSFDRVLSHVKPSHYGVSSRLSELVRERMG